jgi:hypothetical protein
MRPAFRAHFLAGALNLAEIAWQNHRRHANLRNVLRDAGKMHDRR